MGSSSSKVETRERGTQTDRWTHAAIVVANENSRLKFFQNTCCITRVINTTSEDATGPIYALLSYILNIILFSAQTIMDACKQLQRELSWMREEEKKRQKLGKSTFY